MPDKLKVAPIFVFTNVSKGMILVPRYLTMDCLYEFRLRLWMKFSPYRSSKQEPSQE